MLHVHGKTWIFPEASEKLSMDKNLSRAQWEKNTNCSVEVLVRALELRSYDFIWSIKSTWHSLGLCEQDRLDRKSSGCNFPTVTCSVMEHMSGVQE